MATNVRYRISRVITPAASLALVSVDQAKEVLGIDWEDTSQDVRLAQQIDSVSRAVNNYCDRVFVAQSYRDQLRYVHNWLSAGEALRTRQYPILLDEAGEPIVAITEDGAEVTAWDVSPDTGELWRLDGVMLANWAGTTIVIDYAAGFDPIPADVQGATLEWLTSRWYSVGRDSALRSETIPDLITVTYAGEMGAGTSGGSVPRGTCELLDPYRLWSL